MTVAPKAITSLQNERVKAIRALEMRKERKETGLFVAEGISLLVTARDNGFVPQTLVYRSGSATSGIAQGLVAWALQAGVECLEVSEAVLGKLSSKDNPQSMMGVFKQRWAELPPAARVAREAVWLALEEVRDPGNLGTIIRTAHAVGAAGIILVGASCDPYSHECVRATMGSVFAVPLARLQRDAFLRWIDGWQGDIVGTHLDAEDDFRKVKYRAPVLLMMGSEGPGLSEPLTAACTRLVKIPMAGGLDSLNLAVATALVLYQIRGPYLAL
ncbi:MAG: RNA methyltransferase [Hyphomicrobium sp.]|uniref:TrmH family RNA methyltransferase n=1 Tax=Hyphomicrobium sp. TaxID=82 RepID=UPI0013296982|nr:RNA methyltransferase [Hyphomicrobium sp.]KAB2940653.1 MAG: RNA methyltransferase [Hyphomicrobium sp.]MBZ0211024.1 RNA methyltransferase [Hyphomicrobium sp.]MCZ7594861.1 RNA methyltransferase [Hyphomicrobium sp.]